jgi:hypothetical protein
MWTTLLELMWSYCIMHEQRSCERTQNSHAGDMRSSGDIREGR